MQFERFSALREVRLAKESGISVNRFEERSSDWRVLANGERLVAVKVVRELSAMLKCRKNLHLDGGRKPRESKFDVLPRGVVECRLEPELPEVRRNCDIDALL